MHTARFLPSFRREAGIWRAAVLCLLLTPAMATAEEAGPPVAIDGYSPVSYFQKGVAEKGRPEFAVEHEGKRYWLASEAQQQAFAEDPEAYEPAFNAFCPYSLTHGRRVAIDPTRFKIVGGQLLLFHNSEELDALARWEEGDDAKQMKRASAQYELLQFGGKRQGNGVSKGSDVPYPQEIQRHRRHPSTDRTTVQPEPPTAVTPPAADRD